MDSRTMRRAFLGHFRSSLRVVWPILSALLLVMAGLGVVVAWLEGWRLADGVYFAFVSGLTIGYGDLVPKTLLTRALAIAIGLAGIVLTGLVVAIAVQALLATSREERRP